MTPISLNFINKYSPSALKSFKRYIIRSMPSYLTPLTLAQLTPFDVAYLAVHIRENHSPIHLVQSDTQTPNSSQKSEQRCLSSIALGSPQLLRGSCINLYCQQHEWEALQSGLKFLQLPVWRSIQRVLLYNQKYGHKFLPPWVTTQACPSSTWGRADLLNVV